jgi:predicted ArsR family transcriptional regulator
VNVKQINWGPALEKYEKATPEELLRFLYNEKLMSLQEIGWQLDVSLHTVSREMEKFGLERRTMKQNHALGKVRRPRLRNK